MTIAIARFALIISVFSLLTPDIADAAPHIALTQSAAVVEVQNGVAVTRTLRDQARPGERLRYTILAKNDGDRAAAHLTPVAKIPGGELYVDKSAGAIAELSIDGGKTYARQPMVPVKHADGTITMRPALAREIDALRWITPLPLAPGARVSYAYDVIVQ